MIDLIVSGQQLTITTPAVIADSINYLTAKATFFGTEWQEAFKWIWFEKDGQRYGLPFHNDRIIASQGLDLPAGNWWVNVTGNHVVDGVVSRITTNSVLLQVEPSENPAPFPPITPTLSEVISAEVEAAVNVANSVREDADAHRFDGATFTPSVDQDGVISWSNDKDRVNPPDANIKGPAGTRILGHFGTLAALEAAITEPAPGDAYSVGTALPYNTYIYDGVNLEWVDHGQVIGIDATVTVGTTSTGAPDTEAVVTNSGTPGAAVLNFVIPRGKTPEAGVDYFTDDDKVDMENAVAGMVTAETIGAILDPEDKNPGDILAFDGEHWYADSSVRGGVSSVNGYSGTVNTRFIYSGDDESDYYLEALAHIASADWTQDSAYDDYAWRLSIAIPGTLSTDIPEVIFDAADTVKGILAPIATTYQDGIEIYASEQPSTEITIPTVIVWR